MAVCRYVHLAAGWGHDRGRDARAVLVGLNRSAWPGPAWPGLAGPGRVLHAKCP